MTSINPHLGNELDISVKKIFKKNLEAESPVCLKVAAFTKCPKLDFGTVKVGSSKVLELNVINPNDFDVLISLSPSGTNHDFEITWHFNENPVESFVLQPNSGLIVQINWTPSTQGNVRQIITFKWEGRKLQAILFGYAVDDTKKIKDKKQKWLKPLPSQVHNGSKPAASPVKRMALTAIQPETPSRRTTFSITKPNASLQNKENIPRKLSSSPLSFEKQQNLSKVAKAPKFSKHNIKNGILKEQSVSDKVVDRRQTYHIPSKESTKRMLFNKPNSIKDTNANEEKSKHSNFLKRKSVSNQLTKRSLQAGIAIKKLNLKTPKTSMPRHPMPFAAKNMFYDERWIDKQERGFTNWLNFILTPPEDEGATQNNLSQDRRETYLVDNTKNQPIAPTREVLSFKVYSLRRRMARLRRSACLLYQSEEFMFPILKIEKEVECGMLAVRPEKHIEADLGIKNKILKMLLSYNSLWLRIGLEVIYGEVIPLHSNNDIANLSRFITQRLLANPDIAKHYSHPTVPNLYKPGYEEALSKFTMKKFLLLVIFLDHAKQKRLVEHDPCLFNRNSEFKASRDLLIAFSRDYLKGEGDITKHLSYLGISIKHTQSVLDEYDFGIKNIAVDLRDGVRLVRVVELLTKEWVLSTKVRLPAVSRLQKVHNVGLALSYLSHKGLQINQDAKCIVDGHREKTLLILWQIIFHFQVGLLLDVERLKDEVSYLKERLRLRNQMTQPLNSTDNLNYLGLDRRDSLDKEIYFKSERLSLLLNWCKMIGAHYDVKVENFTVSFSDGIAFCCIVNFYHPDILPKSLINHETTLTCNVAQHEDGVEDDFCYDNWTKCFSPNTGVNRRLETLLHNEKENFRILNEAVMELGGIPSMLRANDLSNTIPDEKVIITYVSYLCARLLNLREETQAARKIQLAWRKYVLQKRRALFMVEERAAIKIQACFRGFIGRMNYLFFRECTILCQSVARRWLVQREMKRREYAAELIQTVYKGSIQASILRYRFLQMRSSAMVIQKAFRSYLSRRQANVAIAARKIQRIWKAYKQKKHLVLLHNSVMTLQAVVRAFLLRKRFLKHQQAALFIQSRYRDWQYTKQCRQLYLTTRNSAIKIQQFWRNVRLKNSVQSEYKNMQKAARKLQAWFRMLVAFKRYQSMKSAVVTIATWYRSQKAARKLQAWFRMHVAFKRNQSMKSAVITIATWYRSQKTCRQLQAVYQEKRTAAVLLQAHVRRWLAEKRFQHIVRSIRLVQAWWMSCKETQRAMEDFQKFRHACVRLQAFWRMCIVKKQFESQQEAARKIQVFYKSYKRMREEQTLYIIKRRSAILVQSFLRMTAARNEFLRKRDASLLIQSRWRATCMMRLQRAHYHSTRSKIIRLQSCVRRMIDRCQYHRKREAACKIQSSWRIYVAKRHFNKQKSAAVRIQAFYRSHLISKWFDKIKQASVQIQSLYKMFYQRKIYMRTKDAIVTLQCHWRRRAAQKRFRSQVQSVIVMQAFFRMVRSQKKYENTRQAVIRLQSAFRMTLERMRYMRIRSAVVKIQSHVRKHIQRRCFVQKQQAVIMIQAIIRMVVIRKQYLRCRTSAIKMQAMLRMTVVRKEYLRKRASAIKIQSIMRMHRSRRAFLKKTFAVTKLQSLVRTRIARKTFVRKKDAAILIQTSLRGYFARSSLQHQQISATIVQAVYRMFRDRQKFLVAKQAVVKVQSWYRMILARRTFMSLKTATVKIQTAYRKSKINQKIRNAAVRIQSMYRMHKAYARFKRLQQSVVLLQSVYRMHRTREDYKETRQSCIIVQSTYRAYAARKAFFLKRRAVVTLQSLWRMYQQRAIYLTAKNAAICIQSYRRMYVRRCEFVSQKHAVVELQSVWRMYSVRKKFTEERRAVIYLQAYARMMIARRSFLRKKKAVTAIQSIWKMHKTRARFLRELKAVSVIQSFARANKERKKFNRVKISVVRIQSIVRMFRERQIYSEKKRAVIKLQSLFRMCICQQKYKVIKKSTVKIQSFWRMRCARANLLKQTRNIVKIQAYYRMTRARNFYMKQRVSAVKIKRWYRRLKAHEEHGRQENAVLLLQSWWKMCLERRSFLRQKHAISFIQSVYRNYQCRKMLLLQREHAIKIQSLFKMYLCRKRFHEAITTAIRIQSWYRMLACRHSYTNKKRAAIVIQRRFRAFSLGYSCFLQYHVVRGAIITIQTLVRGYLVRCAMRQKMAAATTIQSFVRMYAQKNKYAIKRRSAVLLQRSCRRMLMVKQYQSMRSNVILIQATVRRWLVQKCYRDMLRQHRAAVKVQAAYRGFMQRRNYICMKESAVQIQRWFRRQNELHNYTKSCIVIQKIWRGYKATKTYKETVISIITIQTWWRNHLQSRMVRLEFCRKIQACKIIQKCYREYLERRQSAAQVVTSFFKMVVLRQNYIVTRAAILCIQQSWRAYEQRRVSRRRKECADVIAKWYRNASRSKVTRQEFIRVRFAARRIQSAYRRSRFRKTVCSHAKILIHQHEAAKTIQRVCKFYMTKKKAEKLEYRRTEAAMLIQRTFLLYLRNKKARNEIEAATRIQQWYRRRVFLKKQLVMLEQRKVVLREFVRAVTICLSVLKIQRWRRVNLKRRYENYLQKRDRAALLIQSMWRGFVVRKASEDRRVKEVRQRISIANKNVTEPMKLCNRTKSALDYLLHVKNLSTVHGALQHLDVVTVLSFKCCEQLVSDNALPVIFKIIKHGNRSLPWISIKQVAFSILLNVAKCGTTYRAVYDQHESIAVILEQMGNYRDKKAFIFPMACNLLTVLCNDENLKKDILNQPKFTDKIVGFYRLIRRQQKLAQQRNLVKEKEQQYTKTAWHRRASFINSRDPYTAISMLVKKLNVEV